MTAKVRIPRNQIPKMFAICPQCERGADTTTASPYASGYHRSHRCEPCELIFYSLSPYDGSDATISPKPFTDRPMTETEAAARMAMWDKEDNEFNVTLKVTNPPVIKRMEKALRKLPKHRTPVEQFLCDILERIEKEVSKMDAATPEKEAHADNDEHDRTAD